MTDVVERAFENLRGRVMDTAVVPPAELIEARGRRRRAGHVALAGFAVLAVIAGGVAVAGRPGTSPSPVAVSPSVPPPAPAGSRSERLPPGILSPESQAAEGGDDHAYSQECFGQPVARRAMSQDIGEREQRVRLGEALYVYRDEATAKAVMRDLRPKLRQCTGFPDEKVLQPAGSPEFGDEAASITVAWPLDGAGEHAGEPFRLLVVRVGTAIVTFDGLVTAPGQDARMTTMIARMCVFRSACPPRYAQPAAPVAGGEAWAVAVGVDAFAGQRPAPHETAGDLAVDGYLARVVPLACDVGAAAALGAPPGDDYSVVYFGSERDAKALADPSGLKVVKVRTYCV
ncbi:hypothetical protein [Dactylosporangium sp. NPDC005555]|uniref:hypothetical protein n=1 Tax=Dactylosporangium sp. NPDC005555 TaxID=3154889 RepID=UPI0033B68F8E